MKFISIFIIGLILASGCLTQITDSQSNKQPTQLCDIETYIESVCENVSYQEEVCQTSEEECTETELSFTISDNEYSPYPECKQSSNNECYRYKFDCYYDLYNRDDELGTWQFRGEVYASESEKPIDLRRLSSNFSTPSLDFLVEVQPDSSERISFSFTADVLELDGFKVEEMRCSITILGVPTKSICEEECKTVTKHRQECQDVEKERCINQ